MNTLAFSYITSLEQNVSQIKNLQWTVAHWQQQYAEAGSLKEEAWRMYGEAIDNKLPHAEILSLYDHACLFNDISAEAWRELQTAKADLILLFN